MDLSSNIKIEDNFFLDIFFSEESILNEKFEKDPAEEIESNVKSLLFK